MAVGRLGGLIIRLVVLLTAEPLNRLTAQTDSPPPQTIDTIIIENRNIFDREDVAPDWVSHLANRLHMRTRPWVIKRRLLLNRGDPFDSARVAESERALRTLGVFRAVRADGVEHNRVSLLVGETVFASADREARREPFHVPLPRARCGLVEVVDVEDEVPLG